MSDEPPDIIQAGTFTMSFGPVTTRPLPVGASQAEIHAAILEAHGCITPALEIPEPQPRRISFAVPKLVRGGKRVDPEAEGRRRKR